MTDTFFHPLLAEGFSGTWDMSLLKKSLNIYEEQKKAEGYSVCHVVSPEPSGFRVCETYQPPCSTKKQTACKTYTNSCDASYLHEQVE